MEKPSSLPLLAVSDFIALTNQTLEYAYPQVFIEGEVASFKLNQGKFVFFDLKDGNASVGCFMMAFQLRVPIEDGMKVIVTAVPKLTNWGKFSLTVQSVKPSGEGSLKKSFELLKAKLDKEGLFDPQRKRALPDMPQRIAVVSSTQAAGYQDFIKILNDRWGGIGLEVAHVQVQGESAPDQIIRAIRYFNEQSELPEVLVLVRGGGSADDLSAFNDEKLVREIAVSRVPVLTGIGHEVDESLADLVADLAASTPSNAAQLLVPDKAEILYRLKNIQLKSIINRSLDGVEAARSALSAELVAICDRSLESIDEHRRNLAASRSVIMAYDPADILERGYALLRGKLSVGGDIEIETAKAIIKAEVKSYDNK